MRMALDEFLASSVPVSSANWTCTDSSFPRSQVNDAYCARQGLTVFPHYGVILRRPDRIAMIRAVVAAAAMSAQAPAR
jgi:hypothetical protein